MWGRVGVSPLHPLRALGSDPSSAATSHGPLRQTAYPGGAPKFPPSAPWRREAPRSTSPGVAGKD